MKRKDKQDNIIAAINSNPNETDLDKLLRQAGFKLRAAVAQADPVTKIAHILGVEKAEIPSEMVVALQETPVNKGTLAMSLRGQIGKTVGRPKTPTPAAPQA